MLKSNRKYMSLPYSNKKKFKKSRETGDDEKSSPITAGNSIMDLPKNVERIPYEDATEQEEPATPGPAGHTGYTVKILEAFPAGNVYSNSSKIPPDLNAGYGPFQKKFVNPYKSPVFEQELFTKRPDKFVARPTSRGSASRSPATKRYVSPN